MEWAELYKFAKEFGVWAALFVGLLIYVLNTSGKRELKLMELSQSLADKYDILDEVHKGVERIERKLDYRQQHSVGGE